VTFVALDLTSIKAAHRKLISATQAGVLLELADAGKFAVDYVKAHPTFSPRSGELQAKTRWVPFRGRAIKIQNTAPHANAIESGARPHVIRPRLRKALRFMAGGKAVFARRVNHPGNRPYKFLWRATNDAGRILGQGLESRMQRAARDFNSSR
jgi:hypothetical protein